MEHRLQTPEYAPPSMDEAEPASHREQALAPAAAWAQGPKRLLTHTSKHKSLIQQERST